MTGYIKSRKRRGMVLEYPDVFDVMSRVMDPAMMSKDTQIDLLEFRMILEIGLAELILERKTPEGLQKVKKFLENEITNEKGIETIQNNISTLPIPDETLDYKKLSYEIDYAIGNLPNKCRIIFKLSKEDGLKYRRIAEKLNSEFFLSIRKIYYNPPCQSTREDLDKNFNTLAKKLKDFSRL
jgi:DNA-binding FadR family transcriptional regulator